MLLYFSRVTFILAHCLIDGICLPVFENIYILIIVLLCLFIHVFYVLIFLNSFFVFFGDLIGNKCAIVCFNVSIVGKYYICAYFVISLCIESKFVLFACIIMFYQINSLLLIIK